MKVTAQSIGIRFERVTGTIGAIVHGIDISDPPGPALTPSLQHALAEHGVLFLYAPDGDVADADFRGVAELFGEMFSYPYGKGADQTQRDVGAVALDATLTRQTRTNYWHTDGSPQAIPPYAALLTPSILPTVGGDTMWASMTAAYEALSSHYQRLLDDLDALHSTHAVGRHYPSELREEIFGNRQESHVHPVIPIDPISGRKYLYVNSNYTERILGLTETESQRLLATLADHVNTPEFHVRLRWEPGTIAIWHERVTQHRAVADFSERRSLRRIVLVGEPPTR